MAIPMILRRRLLGILFARASERESELAPDEINALVSLALRMTIPREEMLAEQFRRPRHGIAAV
jgi:GAF domain-containing protein